MRTEVVEPSHDRNADVFTAHRRPVRARRKTTASTRIDSVDADDFGVRHHGELTVPETSVTRAPDANVRRFRYLGVRAAYDGSLGGTR